MDEFGYISAKQRKADVLRLLTKLQEEGEVLKPVTVGGKTKFVKNFWAQQWCLNLNAYQDMDYRLPVGRSLLRMDAVIHFELLGATVFAKVVDEIVRNVKIRFAPLDEERIFELKQKLVGVSNLVEFLEGKISESVLEAMISPSGLFPQPVELKAICDCLDSAGLCAHSAAVLYAVAAKFDSDPGMFFQLRGVALECLLAVGLPSVAGVDISASEMEKVFDISLL